MQFGNLIGSGFIRISADTAPAKKALMALKAIGSQGGMFTLGGLTAQSIAPVTVAVGALGASLAVAGASASVFAAAVVPQFQDISKAMKGQAVAEDAKTKAAVQGSIASDMAAKFGYKYGQQVKITAGMTAEAKDRAQAYNSALSTASSMTKTAARSQALYKQELEAMPPATRKTAESMQGLKDDFKAWSRSLSGSTMPIFTRGIEWLRQLLPKLSPIVKSVSKEIMSFMDTLGKGQAGKVFKEFGNNVTKNGGGALRSFLDVAKNFVVGVVGILNAFMPMSKGVTGGLGKMTKSFADWGATLGKSGGFKDFVANSKKNGPGLLKTFSDLAHVVSSAVKSLGPFAGVSLKIVQALLSLAAALPTRVLKLLVQAIILVNLAFKAYAVWSGIVTGLTWAFSTSQGASRAQMVLTRIQMFLWNAQLRAMSVWQGIATAAQWAWNAAMDANPIGLLVVGIAALVAAIVWVATKTTWFQTAWKYSWNAIKLAAEYVWHAMQAVWRGIVSAWDTVYRNVVAPIVRFFGKTIPDAAGRMRNFVINAFRALVAFVLQAFGYIIHGAAKLFGWVPGVGKKLKQASDAYDVFAGNVNKSLAKVNDHTVKVPVSFRTVGGTKIFTRAGGGPIDGEGTETSDSNVVLMSRGEHVWSAREVRRAGGHNAVYRLRKAAASGQLPAFAGGGALNFMSSGMPSLKTIGSAMAHAVRAEIDANKKGLFNLLPATALSASGYLGGGGAAPSSGGVNRWRSLVVAMLQMVHQSTGLTNTVLRRMNQESGGNPNIVNRWDSNWQAGHPSVGLMQVIRGTFRAYAGKYLHTGPFSYGVSTNPSANIYASFKYALSRYGSLSNAFNRAGGYDQGGWLMPGMTAAFNGTGKPERVRTAAQEAALGGGDIHIHINAGVFPDSRTVKEAVVLGLETARRQGYKLPKSILPNGA